MPRSAARRTKAASVSPTASTTDSNVSNTTTRGATTPTKWKSPIGVLRGKWLGFESTFALNMLEPWEEVLLLSVLAIIFILLVTGIYRYLPYHLHFLSRRVRFYLLGDENAAFAEAASIFKTKLQR